MSFFSTISAWFSGKPSQRQGGPQSYILEASGLSGQSRGGRRSPAEQVQLLQRLGRFVEKEKVKLAVVLEGKPLREAKDGGVYKGIRVHYSEQGAKAGDLIMKLLRKALRGASVTVITSDVRMEKGILSAGGNVMRPATFRKAIEGLGGDRGQGESGQQRRRPPRRRTRGGSGSDKRAAEGQGRQDKPKEEGPAENSNESAVRELLDLVE